jgi:predicted dehydrogenase
MNLVRFGVIGVGNMGSTHVQSLLEKNVTDGALTAVCDVRPDRLAWAKKLAPGLGAYQDAGDLMKSGAVDAVILATPHYLHPPMAVAAFAQGLHVMTEKPAGVYAKQVREMNEAAEAAEREGLVFGIMYNQRTNPLFRKMREMVREGALGALKRNNWIVTSWYRPQAYYTSGGWRATWAGEGGGVLLNQCPHNLDLWQWIYGMPATVTAFAHQGKWHDIEVEDDVTAYAEYPDGSTGVFVTSTGDTPGDNRFAITGDRGKLVFENDSLTFYKLKTPEREFNKTAQDIFGAPGCEKIPVQAAPAGPESQHVLVLRAFVDAILGRGPQVAPGREGILGLSLSNGMHLSSWLKQTVTLPVDEELFLRELRRRGGGGV